MTMTLRRIIGCAACLLVLTWRAPGHASPDRGRTSGNAALSIRLDAQGRPAYLARFHDGPRRVPESRGPAQRLARELGIGEAASARRLLSNAPSLPLLQQVGPTRPSSLLWPVPRGHFGRGFGFTRTLRKDLKHNGVDIEAAEGTPVRSAEAGLVVYSDNGLRGFGNCVMILHAGGLLTLYAHNGRTTVQAGQHVARGERIALVGHTGYAWGPHLHFELRDRGQLRDPMPRITGRTSDLLLISEEDAADEPSTRALGDQARAGHVHAGL